MILRQQLRHFVHRAQLFGAGVAAFSLLALSILSVSPDAHAWIHAHEHEHADASHDHRADDPSSSSQSGDHVCAVTLAQQGFCDTTPELPRAAASARISLCSIFARREVAWTAPEHWLQPANGPPADLRA